MQKHGEMFLLASHVGVPETLIPLSSTPENIAFSTQLVGNLNSFLCLCAGECEYIRIAARGGSVHISRVSELIRRSPQKPDACPLLFFLEHLRNSV